MSGKAAFVRMLVDAGKAAPGPPVGPALGSKGVKAMDFCKLFNAQTAHIETGTPMRVNMTVAPDRTFDFQILSPPTSHLILKSLNVPKGAPKPTETVGSLSLKHVYEIAKIKKADQGMETVPLESVARSVVAQARNMGVKVVP